MKFIEKSILLKLLTFLFATNLCFAVYNGSGINGALNSLEESSKNLLGVMSIFLLLGAVVLLGLGLAIYFLKAKKSKNKIWFYASIALIVIGILMFIGSILGVVIYLFVPNLISSLLVGSR